MNKSQSGKPPKGTRSHSQGADKIDEQNRPYLIHPSTYMILTEQIMTLMPAERNIILTMNEYELSDINPTHPQTDESPTHIIMFCIRFLSDGLFQPIGALLIYKYENQSKILAECLKAYINDLWKIGLYVMATVSPPFETFKSIMCHLAGIQNFNFYSGVISYSVAPFKEIIHIYDVQFLLIKLQNLFKESDIRFEESYLNQKRYYQASWLDIDYVLTSSKEFKLLSEYFTFNKEVPRRVHIFSEQIYVQLMEAESQGNLSSHADGSLVLLNCIRTFLKFLEQDLVDVQTMTEIHYWDCLLEILQTMQFQKSQCRTCNKETPFNKAHILKNTTIRRKIDFENDNKEEKQKIGKSRSRKKRKKMNKQSSESHKSQGTNIREQALSKILSDDTTVTVHFLNNFESARSQSDNCDIDKNNNSSSDDCPKVKPNKITKKKWKLKNIHKSNKIDDGGRSKTETSDSKGPLKYPRISLKDFSRLSAEDENLLNNENLLNSSRQNVLNNSDSVKEVTTSGGCLKKSISDILNSLNNVQFYSNLCAKNTNVDSQSVKNEDNEYVRTKDASKTCDSDNYVKNQPYEKMSPSNEYLLTNKPKSYGTVPIPTIINPFTFSQDLSQIDLNESKLNSTRDEKNLTKANISDCNSLQTPTESNPFNAFDINKTKKTNFNMSGFPKPKSNISDLIISGTDLSGPNLSKFDLNRPNLSHLDQGESKLTENNKRLNESNVNNICANDTRLSCSNWPQFDVSRSKLDPLNPRQTEKEKNTNEFLINNFSTSESDLSRPKFGYIGSSNTRQLKSNTNMDESVVTRPSLSFLESIESRQMENYRNIKEMCPDNQNLPQSDLNNAISKLNINDTESDANYINSPVRTESNSLSTSTDTASPSDMGKMTSLTDDEHSDSNYSKSVLNFSKNYANSNSQISYRNQVEKRTSDSYGSNKNRFELSNSPFEFGRQNSTNFDLSRQNSINLDLNRQNSTNLDLSRQNSAGYDFNNRTNSGNFNINNTTFSTFDLNRPTTSSFSLNTSQDRSSSSFCETLDFSNDHFCSKSDEETENSIKASCDNVPNILELLSTVEKSPENIDSNDFETNAVTFELLCTVHGIERLFTLLYQRRVKVAKPDAFIVEHIDFLVTIIKERNMINSAAYYGNGYTLLNTELAFSTLQNNAGLYLVSK